MIRYEIENQIRDGKIQLELIAVNKETFQLKKIQIDGINGEKKVEVELPHIISIKENPFENFPNLQRVDIKGNLDYIADGTFKNCVELEEITFPENVNYIGAEAFSGCKKLKKILLPENKETVNPDLCPPHDEMIFGLPDGEELVVSAADSQRIGKNAFLNCSSLKEITLPVTIKRLDNNAFRGCKSLEKIEFPSKLQQIDDGVFVGCENLKEIIIPKTARIAKDICESDKFHKIILPKDHEHQKICQGELLELDQQICGDAVLSLNKKVFWRCLTDTKKTYSIPDGVLTIAKSAMMGRKFKAIRLPKTLKYIREYAFADCTEITEMILPKGVEWIGVGTFYGCTNLKKIIAKGRKSWKEDAWIVDDVRKVEIEIGARKKREQSLTYQPFAEIKDLLKI